MAASIIFPGPHLPDNNLTAPDLAQEELRLEELGDCKDEENITQYDVRLTAG